MKHTSKHPKKTESLWLCSACEHCQSACQNHEGTAPGRLPIWRSALPGGSEHGSVGCRVGRTGRLSTDGHAYSFMTRNLAPLAEPLLKLLQVGRSLNRRLRAASLCVSHLLKPGGLGRAAALGGVQPARTTGYMHTRHVTSQLEILLRARCCSCSLSHGCDWPTTRTSLTLMLL